MCMLSTTASRMKLATANTVQKIRGHAKSNLYPQPEGTLGDTMQKHGKDLGEDSLFGKLGKIHYLVS